MKRNELLELARSVLTLPTAPYHEHAVRSFAIQHCRALGLRIESDRAGNVIGTYRHTGARSVAPLVLVGHMDHPGFEILGPQRAEFLGGVPKELLRGGRLRVFGRSGVVPAKIRRFDDSQWPRRKLLQIEASATVRRGEFGMWAVPMFRVRDGKLHAAAIDDVLSVAVILATLTEIVRCKSRAHLWAVFTRAEEVGFHGAIEVARANRIPREALVVSMEMSKQRPWARMGQGPVVRVGDRMTTFDAEATLFLSEVARKLQNQTSAFAWQRCLMDGGSCEATAFAGFDYRVGGLCLPLGNYHNIGRDKRARAEYVSVDDLMNLVKLTTAAAEQWRGFARVKKTLHAQVLNIRRSAPRTLEPIRLTR